MKKIIILLFLGLGVSCFGQTADPAKEPGNFPDPSNRFAFDFNGVPRYGKYPNDRWDIGALEYVPPELKDSKGKYIKGSYIKHDGTVVLPNAYRPRRPVNVLVLKSLKGKG